MTFKKGQSGNPNGRPADPRVTKIREGVLNLLDDNATNMNKWIRQIAAENPKDAMQVMSGLIEYALPKLARQEHTGKDGESLSIDHILTDCRNRSAGLPIEDK